MSGPRRERLFFALWPDPEIRSSLARLRDGVRGAAGGRPVAPENLHLTLVFLGPVELPARAALESAPALAFDPFELSLSRLGSWPRSRVLWSAPAESPPTLERLFEGLVDLARGHGLDPDRRRFRPHVTLARKIAARVRPRAHDPVRWAVSDYALVRSETRAEGARYVVLARWPLATAGGPFAAPVPCPGREQM